MRLPLSSCIAFIVTLFTFLPSTVAARVIESKSLDACQDNSNFTATLFNVAFTPENNSVAFDVVGVSSIDGNITADIEVVVYGYPAFTQRVDPCTMGLPGLCPMSAGQIMIDSNFPIDKELVDQIPGIAYGVPDLDGLVRIYINDSDTRASIACVEAKLSNLKTVDQAAVGWTTAVIAGLGLVASGVTSGMGHSNTAAHVAANALSLFGFFQAQAFIGMTSVELPPVVQSWTQNFQWSMGIIQVGFVQKICTWYQRSTGGHPTTLLSTLDTTSVQVQKRSLNKVRRSLTSQVYQDLEKRTNSEPGVAETSRSITVKGIDRVGFRAGIEQTNIFMTGAIFFVVTCFFVGILIALFKAFCELAVKNKWMKSDKFQDFRNGWKVVLKGILFRLVLIGFPPMAVLCLWELTQLDSPAEAVFAATIFISMVVSLAWASWKVIRLAKRSVVMHKNPAYMLYSDPKCLNKWGFLYVQYRATAYYFIIPVLLYILVKALFIAFAQSAPIVQAVALLIVEAVFLIGVSVIRPWMDKKTNVFNIFIAAINFLNVIFLLMFTNVFGQPGLVTGVMGVIFFIYNAVFALILLILVLIASVYAIVSKNPDTRYQPMQDDRGSFIKSNPQLTTELDALGAAARGDTKAPYAKSGLDDDDDSFSSGSISRQKADASHVPLPPSTANSGYQRSMSEQQSPVDSQAQHPGENFGRRAAPVPLDSRGMYSLGHSDGNDGQSPQPYESSVHSGDRSAYPHQQYQWRDQNNSSPWQRGAGYEH